MNETTSFNACSHHVCMLSRCVGLITGGGGSIGSELCRQLAKMEPKQLIILDIYENGAYDVQQELKIAYSGKLNLQVEIASITNRKAMERVFETYHPQIVINAAAHKQDRKSVV